MRKTLLTLPLAALGLAGSAHAYDPIVLERGWNQLSYDKDRGCEAEVRGNGQIYYIYAVGLGANALGRYFLTNENMEPIEWRITADDNGEWARYYIPFGYTPRDGGLPKNSGTVRVNISTDQCSLDLAFGWGLGYPVIETDGTTHIVNDDDYAAQQSDRF